MRRILLTGAAVVALCCPAEAFDFTARSFGPLFDRDFRLDHVKDTDHCSDWEHDGGACEYGIDKDFNAWVSDSPIAGHPAMVIALSWAPKPGFFDQHQDAALRLTDLCQPHVDRDRRVALLRRLWPIKSSDGTYTGGKEEVFEDVKYRFNADWTGLITLSAEDLTLPNGLTP